jgi:hypothetical protein
MAKKVNKNKQNLTEKQRKIILTVLSARNVSEGCKEAGISRGRWYQLMRNKTFRQAYEDMSQELMKDALLHLKDSVTGAVTELRKIAFANINEVISFNESGASFLHNSEDIPPEIASAIRSVEVVEEQVGDEKTKRFVLRTKVKMHDKLRANQLLLEHAMRLMEIEEISKRLDSIEEQLRARE